MSASYWIAWAVLSVVNLVMFVASLRVLGRANRTYAELRAYLGGDA